MNHHLFNMRRNGAAVIGAVACTLLLTVPHTSLADPRNYAVMVASRVATSPPSMTLYWVQDAGASQYTIYRKSLDAASWGSAVTQLTGTATSYVDAAISPGVGYEYRIDKSAGSYSGYGYLYGGIGLPAVENRGKVILIVATNATADLFSELGRLELDLAGDGWSVLRHDVATGSSVTNIKAIIRADYTNDASNVKALFLFGHVPVPYSGNIAPDGHSDHVGAWPADVYYGDMDGTWTDNTVSNNTTGRVKNVPGDGRFDQSYIPSDLELMVGRVDLVTMPSFPNSEKELLRQYLAKDHNFRHGYATAVERGLVDDNFGDFGGEAFAASAWRSFPPLVGAANVWARDFSTVLTTNSYLWSYGCGGGSYTSAGGVDTTAGIASGPRRTIFTLFLGSYFGDWDVSDNFMRAALASFPSALSCAWSGRPHWFHHHMALGLPIGFSTRLIQNNDHALYQPSWFGGMIHVALMGDPTLRLKAVPSPAALALATNVDGVHLAWEPSSDGGVLGYHVYRADGGPSGFSRLTSSALAATNWTDSSARATDVWYMVRAVKLEETPSGSYTNLSQGIFNRLTLAGAVNHPPSVTNQTLTTPEDTPVSLALAGADSDGGTPFCSIRSFPSHGRLVGPPTNMAYRPFTNWFGSDSFEYYAGDDMADSAPATVAITVSPVNDPPVASSQSVTATNNRPRTITLVATDAESDPITLSIISWPVHGTLTGTPPNVVYTPTNYTRGTDAFSFQGFDGTAYGNTGTVTITVVDPPVALPDSVATAEDTPIVINVLTNDTDPNGYALLVASVTAPAHGALVNNKTNVTYSPTNNWYGTDSFSYTITNAYLGTASAMVTVTVVSVNDAPVAQDASLRALENRPNPVTLVAGDVENDPLTFAILSGPFHGALSGSGSNRLYQPSTNYVGGDTFTFEVNDGHSGSDTGVVWLTVAHVYPPVDPYRATNGIDYAYYEGPFTNLPDLSGLTPVKQGVSSNGLDISVRQRDTNFAFRFSGLLWVPATADYSFRALACKQAQMTVWTQDVFACTGLVQGLYQSEASVTNMALEAGLHPLAVTYYRDTNSLFSPWLTLSYINATSRYETLITSSVLYRVVSRPVSLIEASPATGSVPLEVMFDGSGSTASVGQIVRHDWTFGDGASATGAVVTHRYERAGAFAATLTVTADDGLTGWTNRLITVWNRPNPMPYAESFEGYAAGATMLGCQGWGQGTSNATTVVAFNYASNYTGGPTWPLNTSPHTRYLQIQPPVTNMLSGGTNRLVWVEYVGQGLRLRALGSNVMQFTLSINSSGHPFVYHGRPADHSAGWTEIPTVTIQTSEWARFGYRIDYETADTNYNARYFQIYVNSTALSSPLAYTANDGSGTTGGTWFALADSSQPYLSSVIFLTAGGLDDLVVTDADPFGHATEGTPNRWLMDRFGITNDYDEVEQDDPDRDGAPNWKEYVAGTDPKAASSVFSILDQRLAGGSNVITWYATTNNGVATPCVMQRATNLPEGLWTVVASNLWRHTSGTNRWADTNLPPLPPVYYRPAIPPAP